MGSWTVIGEEPMTVINAIEGNLTTGERGLRIPEIYPRAHLLPNGRIFVACLADGERYS